MLESNTGTCYISLPLCSGGSRGVRGLFEPLLSLNYFSFMGSFRKNCSNCTNRTPTPSANLNPRIKNPGFAPAMAVFATFLQQTSCYNLLEKDCYHGYYINFMDISWFRRLEHTSAHVKYQQNQTEPYLTNSLLLSWKQGKQNENR